MKAHVLSAPVRSHRKAVNLHSLAMRVFLLRPPWRVSSMKPNSCNSLSARAAVPMAILHSCAASRTEYGIFPLFEPLYRSPI